MTALLMTVGDTPPPVEWKWLPMSSARRTGSVILCLGEVIPDVPYVRTASYITRKDAFGLGFGMMCPDDGGWFIGSERCEDWDFVPIDEPRGWLPLPDMKTEPQPEAA